MSTHSPILPFSHSRSFWYPPILTYHRIQDRDNNGSPTVTPALFDQQLAMLSKYREPVPLNQLIHQIDSKKPIPRKWVAITFDDGEANLYRDAFPILKKHRIPAAIFMITDRINKSGFLNQEQILEMAAEQITFGSHTHSHAYLPELSESEIHLELAGSKAMLEHLQFRADYLSYPAGGFTEAIQKIAQEIGYQAGLTTNRGVHRFPLDPWAIRRISMHNKPLSRLGLAVRCSGYYGINRRLRAPH